MITTSRASDSGHRRRIIRVAALLVLGALVFVWGVLTVHKRIFPYDFIQATVLGKKKSDEELRELNRYWARQIVSGGYILHFRHGQREKWHDVTAFDAYELLEKIDAEKSSFARATCLTPQGIEESRLIGNVFRITGVQVSEVISSPSCRARQTAELAFGRVDAYSNSLLHLTAVMPAQHAAFSAELRRLIMTVEPKPGQNVVLVGHINTLRFGESPAITVDKTDGLEHREETGFVVIEKIDGELVAQHKFNSIKDFVHAIVELPVK